MEKLSQAILKTANNIVVTAFIAMFLLVFGNVLLRFLFSSGLTFSDEIARYAFLWCTFLGAAIAAQKNAHIGIAGIRPFVPARYHRWIDITVSAVVLVIIVIVLIGSFEILIANMGTRAPFTGAPIWIAQSSIIVGCLGFLGIFSARLWRSVRQDRESS